MNMAFEQGLEKKKRGGALIRGEALIRDYTVSIIMAEPQA